MSRDITQETRELIEEMRAKRAALGDTTRIAPKRIHYKRMTRPIIADGVLFVYTFVSGMLFGPVLQGMSAAIIGFMFIVVAMAYTYLKE